MKKRNYTAASTEERTPPVSRRQELICWEASGEDQTMALRGSPGDLRNADGTAALLLWRAKYQPFSLEMEATQQEEK